LRSHITWKAISTSPSYGWSPRRGQFDQEFKRRKTFNEKVNFLAAGKLLSFTSKVVFSFILCVGQSRKQRKMKMLLQIHFLPFTSTGYPQLKNNYLAKERNFINFWWISKSLSIWHFDAILYNLIFKLKKHINAFHIPQPYQKGLIFKFHKQLHSQALKLWNLNEHF